jgi:dethiobiotin synthetase
MRHTVREWMTALGLPVVLVAGSYLGTISHTLTALDVLARAGLPVAALVVNESADSTVPLEETIETLARFAGAIRVVALHRSTGAEEFERLWKILRAAKSGAG